MQRTVAPTLIILLTCAVSAAIGQGLPSIPGASSLMPSLPNMSLISPGNAAGVLGYCVENKVLGGSSATSTLGGLMKKPNIATSDGYLAGKNGTILPGNGQKFALNKVPSQLKSQACNQVLKQAPKFL
jgi:hypothetical protein